MQESRNKAVETKNVKDIENETATKEVKNTLCDVAALSYLSKSTAHFSKRGDFLALTLEKDGEKEEFERVWLHRVFPFDAPDEYISVQTREAQEIGLIRRLSDFDGEEVEILKEALDRKYFVPKILKITSLKEKRGFTFWKAVLDIGEVAITVQDTYRSLLRVGSDKAFLIDTSGNRFEIESLEALDRKSRKKLELYL